MKTITLLYFASVRHKTGIDSEIVSTNASTVQEIYNEIKEKYNFDFSHNFLKVAINEEYANFSSVIKDNDTIVFIPPVAGG